MDDAVVINFQKVVDEGSFPEADVYIWQKYCWIEAAEQLRARGSVNWWDLCDPMHWFSPEESERTLDVMNGGIVASNQGLAADVAKWAGREVHVVADRIESKQYPKYRIHHDVNPVRFVWFGIYVNRIALGGALATLDRLNAKGHDISLTIFDEQPNKPLFVKGNYPTYYTRWDLHLENRVLSSHDIALLPPFPGEWGRVKSDNKTLTAWANGLPVMNGTRYHDGIETMVEDFMVRDAVGQSGRKKVFEDHHVRESAREWMELLGADNV